MPTIFDQSQQKQDTKLQELEQKLDQLQAEEAKKPRQSAQERMIEAQSQAEESAETSAASESKQSESDTMHRTTSEPADAKPSPSSPHRLTRDPKEYSAVLREEKAGHVGPFAAFVPQPRNMRFETQHEHEHILMVLRQHPVVNVVWISIAVVLILAPFFLFPLIPLFEFIPGIYSMFIMIGWYMFVTLYIVESFLGWYYNMYVITDERIIDIDFYALIYKAVSEAKIEKIEDVTATTAGFFGSFFNYGNIAIQTAAEKREFEFARVPQPAKVTKFLNELILEEEREKIEGRVM